MKLPGRLRDYSRWPGSRCSWLAGEESRYDSGSPKSDWTSEAAGTKAVIVRRQVGGDAPHPRRR